MLTRSLRLVDKETRVSRLKAAVGQLTIAQIESMSISDISKLRNNVLKDLLNDAIRNQLAYHLGGAYTTAPSVRVRDQQQEFAKHSVAQQLAKPALRKRASAKKASSRKRKVAKRR